MDPAMRKDNNYNNYAASEGVTSNSNMPPSYASKDRHGEGLGYQSGMPASTAQEPMGHTAGATTYGTTGNRDSVASTAVASRPGTSGDTTASDILLIIMAIFLPPVAVFLKRGLHGDFWINVLLCILVWFPGVLHAFYVIFKYRGVSDASGNVYSKRRGI